MTFALSFDAWADCNYCEKVLFEDGSDSMAKLDITDSTTYAQAKEVLLAYIRDHGWWVEDTGGDDILCSTCRVDAV